VRRKRGKRSGWGRRTLLALVAVPLAYLLTALLGALLPVNAGWQEPKQGTTIYLRNNGVHVDLVLPAVAHGLDWRPLLPESHFAAPPFEAPWFGFGAGERRVYLDTPTWSDLTPRTTWAALTGGERILHVDRTASPGSELHAIRLRPEEYRRLWAAIRADFDGPPRRIEHPGYGPDDAFYHSRGRASALSTCNNWVADKLRIAGVKTSLWSPFVQGLVWRYGKAPVDDRAVRARSD
jgi:uncharacterized protein (TIGR02117 family)